jgi:hypothetical protein
MPEMKMCTSTWSPCLVWQEVRQRRQGLQVRTLSRFQCIGSVPIHSVIIDQTYHRSERGIGGVGEVSVGRVEKENVSSGPLAGHYCDFDPQSPWSVFYALLKCC